MSLPNLATIALLLAACASPAAGTLSADSGVADTRAWDAAVADEVVAPDAAPPSCMYDAPCTGEGICGPVECPERCWGCWAPACEDGRVVLRPLPDEPAVDCGMANCDLPLHVSTGARLRVALTPPGCKGTTDLLWLDSSHAGPYIAGQSGFDFTFASAGTPVGPSMGRFGTLMDLPRDEEIRVSLDGDGLLFTLLFTFDGSSLMISRINAHDYRPPAQ